MITVNTEFKIEIPTSQAGEVLELIAKEYSSYSIKSIELCNHEFGAYAPHNGVKVIKIVLRECADLSYAIPLLARLYQILQEVK